MWPEAMSQRCRTASHSHTSPVKALTYERRTHLIHWPTSSKRTDPDAAMLTHAHTGAAKAQPSMMLNRAAWRRRSPARETSLQRGSTHRRSLRGGSDWHLRSERCCLSAANLLCERELMLPTTASWEQKNKGPAKVKVLSSAGRLCVNVTKGLWPLF